MQNSTLSHPKQIILSLDSFFAKNYPGLLITMLRVFQIDGFYHTKHSKKQTTWLSENNINNYHRKIKKPIKNDNAFLIGFFYDHSQFVNN